MKDFDKMNDTVDAICYSLENECHKWDWNQYTLNGKGFEFWIANTNSITQTWRPTQDTVFSYEQGKRIKASFEKCKEAKASNAQQKLMNSFKKEPPHINLAKPPAPPSPPPSRIIGSSSPWWKFWS